MEGRDEEPLPIDRDSIRNRRISSILDSLALAHRRIEVLLTRVRRLEEKLAEKESENGTVDG